MSANMKSFIDQTGRNIDELIQQKKYSDINTQASMMLEPEFGGYDPKPKKPPEREFIESMEAIPGFTPAPAQQSVWAPLISGISQGMGTMAGADFS